MKIIRLSIFIAVNFLLVFFSASGHSQIEEIVVIANQRPAAVGELDKIKAILAVDVASYGDTLARDIQSIDDAEEACEEAIDLDRRQCEINVLEARMSDYETCSQLLLIPSAQIEIEFNQALAGFRGVITTVSGEVLANNCMREVDRKVEIEMLQCKLLHDERAIEECNFFGG